MNILIFSSYFFGKVFFFTFARKKNWYFGQSPYFLWAWYFTWTGFNAICILDLDYFIYCLSFFKPHKIFYLCFINMVPGSESHSFPIQSPSHKKLCSVYSTKLWDFIELFEDIVIVNKLGRNHGSYPDFFMRIQYFNHLLEGDIF